MGGATARVLLRVMHADVRAALESVPSPGVAGVVDAMVRYVCSPEVYTCLLRSSPEPINSACLSYAGGTVGAVAEPWSTVDAQLMRFVLVVLVVAVVWLSVMVAGGGRGVAEPAQPSWSAAHRGAVDTSPRLVGW